MAQKELNQSSTEIFQETEKINETTSFNSLNVSTTASNIKKFDPKGAVTIRNWLRYFEKKTETYTDSERVQIFSDFLEGSALDLFIEELLDVTDWNEIKENMMNSFSSEKQFSFTDFTDLKFVHCADLKEYYTEKIKIGRQLKLAPTILIQGLTDGLPERKKELFLLKDIATTTDWLCLANKLIKPNSELNRRNYPREEFPRRPAEPYHGSDFRRQGPSFLPRQAPRFQHMRNGDQRSPENRHLHGDSRM